MKVVGLTLVIVEGGRGTALSVIVDKTVLGGADSVLYDTTVEISVVGCTAVFVVSTVDVFSGGHVVGTGPAVIVVVAVSTLVTVVGGRGLALKVIVLGGALFSTVVVAVSVFSGGHVVGIGPLVTVAVAVSVMSEVLFL